VEIADIMKHPSQEWKVYEAALWYIDQDIRVLPLVKNGKRLPAKEFNVSYSNASKSKRVITKWFHPEEGRFPGWNIGIACGIKGGVFAVDIDRHGGEDGLLNFERQLERAGEEFPVCPTQVTPNDGLHLLFKWQENASSSTNKIAKCVDTRGGTETSSKGHIVAFPSIVEGKMYEWKSWPEAIPDIPKWMTDLLGVHWNPPASNRGNEQVTSDDVNEAVPVDQIEKMLTFIDPNECDYDKWLKVGMAIKSQQNNDEGLELWDNWSKKGERYSPGECYIRWEGFDDLGNVRAGTLFFYAREGGWKIENHDAKGNSFDEVVAKMNETYAVVSIGGKIRILAEREIVCDTDMHYQLLDKESFKTLLQNQTVLVKVGGKTKRVGIADVWLGHEGRRTYINGISLFPDGRVPEGYFNTWNGFSVKPEKGKCNLFFSHIKNVLCDNNDDLYEWILDWLADLVQDPANPKGCAVVMRGPEGSGKGLLANTIGELFGPHHRHLIDDTHLTSNFNAHLLDAITVFADEITWGGNKKTAGKLKGMVTERNLVGERKGVDALLYRNMIHVFIASNSDWVIPAGAGSRRWFVLDVSGERCGDRKYFNAILNELKNGGKSAILYELLNREITNDLRVAPETKGLSDQRMLNTQGDTVFQWWRKCLISEKIPVIDLKEDENVGWPSIVSKIGLYEAYEEYASVRRERPVIENVFAKKVTDYGIKATRPTINKRRQRVYEIPSIKVGIAKINKIIPGAIIDDNPMKKGK